MSVSAIVAFIGLAAAILAVPAGYIAINQSRKAKKEQHRRSIWLPQSWKNKRDGNDGNK